MKFRSLFLVLLLVACRKETVDSSAQPATVTNTTTIVAAPKDLTGQKVDTTLPITPPVSGCEVKPEFAANEPIDFTMHLAEAPEKLHVSVRILQADEEIAFVRLPAEGKKTVTLRLPKLEPGKYRLVGLWGGNAGCEKEIEVRK